MRPELEKLVGEEICVTTVPTDEIQRDGQSGFFVGTLRRIGETALELRRRDGNLSYIALKHIVRFYRMP